MHVQNFPSSCPVRQEQRRDCLQTVRFQLPRTLASSFWGPAKHGAWELDVAGCELPWIQEPSPLEDPARGTNSAASTRITVAGCKVATPTAGCRLSQPASACLSGSFGKPNFEPEISRTIASFRRIAEEPCNNPSSLDRWTKQSKSCAPF